MQKAEVYNRIQTYLESAGYKIGACGDFVHANGLPPGVPVAPDHTVVHGSTTLMVDTTCVRLCILRYPTGFNQWLVVKEMGYRCQEDLDIILDRHIHLDQGCWALVKAQSPQVGD